MTGQIAFARTLRALDADDSRASKLGLLTAIILLAAWTWWMLTPSVPQYEVLAENASLSWAPGSHSVFVNVPPISLSRVRKGQNVQLHFGSRTIVGQVSGTFFFQPPGRVTVLVAVHSGIEHPLPSKATLESETNRVSPATIALRTLQ